MSGGLIWLASYPKSGNTWIRFLLESLARAGAAVDINCPALPVRHAADRAIVDDLGLVASSELTDDETDLLRPCVWDLLAAMSDTPVIVKVHDARRETPGGSAVFGRDTDLVIYIVRDPRDVACSIAAAWAIPIDDAIEFMTRSDSMVSHPASGFPARVGNWSQHVDSWATDSPLTMVVQYEELQSEATAVGQRLATFLGWPATPAVLAASVRATRFEDLRRQEDAWDFAERPSTAERFFRRGGCGTWRTDLSRAQAARIEAAHRSTMRRFGYV